MVSPVSPPKECVALRQPDDGLIHPLRELLRHAGRGDGLEDRQNSCLQVKQNFLCLILVFLNGVAAAAIASASGGPTASS
jgi:hypothetical protein